MNQFNAFHCDKLTEPPIKWNSQPPLNHFKSSTSPLNNIPVVSSIMGRLNHLAIDNGDVEVHLLDFSVEYNSEYITDPDTTPINSIDDDKVGHLL